MENTLSSMQSSIFVILKCIHLCKFSDKTNFALETFCWIFLIPIQHLKMQNANANQNAKVKYIFKTTKDLHLELHDNIKFP